MANFTVEPAVLMQKAADLNQCAETYESISTQLHTAATTLGSAYDTEDNRTYVNRMEECVKDLKAMAEKLKESAQTITEQANIYVNQQVNNTQSARKLPG